MCSALSGRRRYSKAVDGLGWLADCESNLYPKVYGQSGLHPSKDSVYRLTSDHAYSRSVDRVDAL